MMKNGCWGLLSSRKCNDLFNWRSLALPFLHVLFHRAEKTNILVYVWSIKVTR